MRGVLFSSGMRIIRNILDWLQSSKDNRILDDNINMINAGTLKNSQNQLTLYPQDKEFKIVTGTGNDPQYSIKVTEGVAYNVLGERIVINTVDTLKGHNLLDATLTTYDGNTYQSTPKSTGSDYILLTNGSTNYIWISYLKVCDPTIYTLHKGTDIKEFYQWDDGFRIDITTTATYTINPTTPINVSNPLLLGSVDLSASPAQPVDYSSSITNYASRIYGGIKQNRVKVTTPRADKFDITPAATYAAATEIFLDDHIKAVGAGTPSSSNPHALTLSDMGASNDQIVSSHQSRMHVDGIISSIDTIFFFSSTGLTATIANMQSGLEYINIGGIIVTNEIVAAANTLDLSGNIVLPLSPSITDYYIQVSSAGVFSVASSLTSGNFPLYKVTTSGAGVTSTTDLRVFGTTNSIRTIKFSSDNGASYTPNIGVKMLRGRTIFASIGSGSIGLQAILFPTSTKQFFDANSITISCGTVSSLGGGVGSDFVVGTDSITLTGFTLRCKNNGVSATNIVVSWVVIGS